MNQRIFEYTLLPCHLAKDIKEYLLVKYKVEIDSITTSLREYISQSYWDSKNERLSILKQYDTEEIILDVLTQLVLIAGDYIPLISACTVKQIKGLSKVQSIQTIGDILHCIDSTDLILWDITKDNKRIIKSNISLSDELENRLKLLCVLPPMSAIPRTLRHNKSSGYLTINKDRLILGDKENYHEECISLDVLNTLNSQALQLDLDICYKFEKEFTSEFDKDTDEYRNQKKTYERAKEQFEFFRDKIQDHPIHFTHKVDKRGRVYSQGYHMNYQASSYEKACISLKTKEFVRGEL